MPLETIIIGAGQAGLALSHHLALAGHGHVVLERGRVGERWRSERWDSLTLLTPNWLNRLPGASPLPDPDGYLDREGVIAHLERYAATAPVHEGTTVRRVRPTVHGYHVATDRGDWHAGSVVIATGDCDVPRIPAAATAAPPWLAQLHASRYRRPDELPEGGVLVVGAGPTGQQLADELRRSGRHVVLAVGRHARMPRTYRGRDAFAWLHDAGQLDVHADEVPNLAAARRAPSFPVSGAAGGSSLGLDRLAGLGVVVAGRLTGFTGRHALFGSELESELRDADRRLRRALAHIDGHIERTAAAAAPAEITVAGVARSRAGAGRARPRRPHGAMGDRLQALISLARGPSPRRHRRAAPPGRRDSGPGAVRARAEVPTHPQVALPGRRRRRRDADRRTHRRRRWRCPAAEGRMSAAAPQGHEPTRTAWA